MFEVVYGGDSARVLRREEEMLGFTVLQFSGARLAVGGWPGRNCTSLWFGGRGGREDHRPCTY